MAVTIHPSAIVEEGAELDEAVSIGPYAYIGASVRLGKGTCVAHHATIDGATTLGADNEIHPYAYVGAKTHDLKYKGGSPGLRIGSRNIFREYVTVHCATEEGSHTLLGDDNVILAYSHIAHDCNIGNHFVMSSHAALAGHVTVGDHVNFGWGAGIHQFSKIGSYAMIAAMARVTQDVPPYMIVEGSPAGSRTINKVGLERAGFSAEDIMIAHRIHKIYFKQGLNRTQAGAAMATEGLDRHPLGLLLLNFIKQSTRGIC
jgi:UDP-N-acetylglucosamine acyltransferase